MFSILRKRAAEELRSDILAWIAPTLTRKPIEDQHTVFEKRDPETGRWFLDGDLFRSWRNPNGPFLWMYGDVGCGKTILCCSSSIINELKRSQAGTGTCQSTNLVYFYFTFDDVQKQDLGVFLRSALEQLCPRDGILPQVEDLYQRCEPDPPSTFELQQTFLQTLRSVSKSNTQSSHAGDSKSHEESSCNGTRHTYIVLDGLDEVQYGPKRNAILKLLRMISALDLRQLHLLVSSRRETDIEVELLSIVRWQPLQVTQQNIEKDLNIFVTNQISESQKLRSQSELVKDEIKHKLVGGANGMFRWTALQMQELNKKHIHTTYDRILTNVEASLVHEAVSILKWLSCSGRPLFIEELTEACIIHPEEDPAIEIDMRLTPSDILEILPGLIAVDPPIDVSKKDFEARRHIFSLAHFSVKEYLFKRGTFVIGSQNIELNAVLAQKHIVGCCLSYISFCQLNNSYVQNEQSAREFHKVVPLRLYAYSRWALHAAPIPDEHSKEFVTKSIQLLCQPKICHEWMTLTTLANSLNEEIKPCVLGPPRSWHSKQNWPPSYLLCYSVVTGNTKIVESLLKMDVPISGPHAIGEPLRLAAEPNQTSLVDILLKAGASKDKALVTALQKGNEDIAWRILQSSEIVGSDELIAAAKCSSSILTKKLIEKAANVELIDINRAILAAILSSNFDTANALLGGMIARGQLSNIISQESSSSDGETVWQDILSSATTLDSRSLLRFLLQEVPLDVIERLNTQDLYLLSVVLGCSQSTRAFVSYPWFKIPPVARTLAKHWESLSISNPISTMVVGVHELCTGRDYPIASEPIQESTLETWNLLYRWRPEIVSSMLKKWGFKTIDQIRKGDPCFETDYPQKSSIQRHRVQPFSNLDDYNLDLTCQRMSHKYISDLLKSSSHAL
ncbi:uncharacterized protein LY89DRAFT_669553 [Mollisia scopiformis]|uniref:Nephrocystin 3-like N-terminal domain-containing protein n=1 Tax=Mollisia scopiformis TaxID=149040 RepID=A0A194XAD7_MOLSC|nr:uncharacterized protein LY89DRAFT_669553 [Mollisia scopiformis]KUJ17138.1 hypothetical protein LY89DRAFT_669553 [Mollisia scopiformis]